MRAHYLARLRKDDNGLVAVDFMHKPSAGPAERAAYRGPGSEGDIVEVRVHEDIAEPVHQGAQAIEAEGNSAVALIYEIAAAHQMDPIFCPEALREVEAIVADPGFDDPKLRDLRELAFVTIDNADSRDLDQAMFIEALEDGFRVVYALADASYYLRPRTALFDEALKRGATYYFPGFAVPMLPRALSEDLVSLNPAVDRRAFIFDMRLDAQGEVLAGARGTQCYRALIRSRAKLSYPGVQTLHDHWDTAEKGAHALDGHDYTDTLRQLRVVGELRMQLALERDVVRYRRRELLVGVGPKGTAFSVVEADRNDVERWNEQISLLCNCEGARLMVDAGAQPNLQAIFRVHAPPHHRRVQDLDRIIDRLVEAHDLPPNTWRWDRDHESLAQYLDRLPDTGTLGRVGKAIQRLALVINNRSEFSDRAAIHHGVGADAYARFSSPMRELVGVFTHKEAIELLDGEAGTPPDPLDLELQTRIIEIANLSKSRQSKVTKAANKVAIDALLRPQLQAPIDRREWMPATLMGVTPRQAYVQLDRLPIELKVYFGDRSNGPIPGTANQQRLAMRCDEIAVELSSTRALLIGDPVRVRVLAEQGERFVLELAPPSSPPLRPPASRPADASSR